MGVFSYRAYAINGDNLSGELDAPDIKTAKRLLNQQGLLAYEISEINDQDIPVGQNQSWFKLTPAKPTPLQVAEFTEFLAILLGSGLAMDQCLKLCEDQAPSTLQPVISKIKKEVVSGKSLSSAMGQHNKKSLKNQSSILPNALIVVVRAGETSGKLADALASFSKGISDRHKIYSEITASMIYPAIILTMSVIAIGVISTFLVPAFMPIFEQSGASVPFIIAVLANISEFVGEQKLLLGLMLLLSLLIVITSLRTKTGLHAIQSVLLRLPFIGTLLQESEQSKVFSILAILLENNVELTVALNISADVSFLAPLRISMNEVSKAVQEGEKFSSTIQNQPQFPELACRMIAIGEETNQLGRLLQKLSDIQSTRVKAKLERFVVLLTPAITVTMGILIGALMIGTMQAILSINELSL